MNEITFGILGSKMDGLKDSFEVMRTENKEEHKQIYEIVDSVEKRVTKIEDRREFKKEINCEAKTKDNINWWKMGLILTLVLAALTYVSGILK